MCVVLVSFNCLDEVDLSLVCLLFEGFSFVIIDFENFEGVWLESFSSVDVFNM